MDASKVDITGKRLANSFGGYIQLRDKTKQVGEGIVSIELRVDEDGLVDSMKFDPERRLSDARTSDEYHATHLYEVARLALPMTGCPENSENAFYIYVHSVMKPDVEGPIRGGYASIGSATDEMVYRSKKPNGLCGVFVSYRREHGVSTVYMDSRNPSGRFDNESVRISVRP